MSRAWVVAWKSICLNYRMAYWLPLDPWSACRITTRPRPATCSHQTVRIGVASLWLCVIASGYMVSGTAYWWLTTRFTVLNVWRSRRKTWSSGSVLYTVRNLRKGAFLSAVMYWRLETTGYSLFQLQRCGSASIYSKVVCCAPGTMRTTVAHCWSLCRWQLSW